MADENKTPLAGLTLSDEQQASLNSLLAAERRLNERKGYERGIAEASAELEAAKQTAATANELQAKLDAITAERDTLSVSTVDLNTKVESLTKETETLRTEVKKGETALQTWVNNSKISTAIREAADWGGEIAIDWVKGRAKIDGDNVVIQLDENTTLPIAEAVAKMDADTKYHSLFAAKGTGGVGQHSGHHARPEPTNEKHRFEQILGNDAAKENFMRERAAKKRMEYQNHSTRS